MTRKRASPLLTIVVVVQFFFVGAVLGQSCSETNPCSDGAFCNFDDGTSGFCEGCVVHPHECFKMGLPSAGAEDCEVSCSPEGCSMSAPCSDNYFCNFDNGEAGGTCEVCVGHPDECSELGLPDAGFEACEASCHPKQCSDPDPCPMDYFCNFDLGKDDGGFCEGCVAPDECRDLGLPNAGAEDCEVSCVHNIFEGAGAKGCSDLHPCPDMSSMQCSDPDPCPMDYFCNFDLGKDGGGFCEGCVAPDECWNLGLPDAGAEDCEVSCVHISEGASAKGCSSAEPCGEGSFCTFHTDEDGGSGVCEECFVWHPFECFNSSLTDAGAQDCAASCNTECFEEYISDIIIGGVGYNGTGFSGSPSASAAGPLIDCGRGLETCSNAEGAICLVERGDITFWEKVLACENGGGAGVVIFNNEVGEFGGVLAGVETAIPSISMSQDDGQDVLENDLGSLATVSVEYLGEYCRRGCSDLHPCPDKSYCNYDLDDHGWCEECTQENLNNCYFSGLPQRGAQDCERVCGAKLEFPDCKFCPSDISAAGFGGSTQCMFCPQNDMQYPNREIPMFGPGIVCWLVEEFFTKYQVDINNDNCKLAQMMNYMCGCTGPGYAGANTETKRVLLVWLPRASAILSFVGSTIIIVDIARNKQGRQKVSNQLMAALSFFDLFGSVAYALTSLPLPQADYIYGSKGNDATCKAQGFFIQVGTISAYTNVSLAFYYLFLIKFGWTEREVQRKRLWFFLTPIVVGLTFAFAGLPYYDNMILWCNNSANWWPDVPMLIAIVLATAIMLTVCWHVYKEERASRRWRTGRGTGGNSFSSQVFRQSMWYLMAFYMTWPPYLALQYLWASGRAYSMYGFVLYAGTVLPLQGFWNCLVYARRRVGGFSEKIRSTISSTFSGSTTVGSMLTRSRKSSNGQTSLSRSGPGVATEEKPGSLSNPNPSKSSIQTSHEVGVVSADDMR